MALSKEVLDNIDTLVDNVKPPVYGNMSADKVEASVSINMALIPMTRMEAIAKETAKLFSKRLTPVQTLMAARSILAKINAIVAPVAVCKRGCSHCCKQAVVTLSVEAEIIARRYGEEFIRPEILPDPKESEKLYNGVACPFLANNECTIYDERPLSCRSAWNLSIYPQLCDNIDNPNSGVPNINTKYLTDHVVKSIVRNNGKKSLQEGVFVTDIRHMFKL